MREEANYSDKNAVHIIEAGADAGTEADMFLDNQNETAEPAEDIRPYLQRLFQEAGISCGERQADQLQRYLELLREWNGKMNLTAITEPKEAAVKHFLDSALLLRYLDESVSALEREGGSAGLPLRVIDVGTGAGFPGLVLKILRPDIRLTLLDSLRKRLLFLEEVCRELGVEAETVHARAEEGGRRPQLRCSFDAAVARAVAPMNLLTEYCMPFVRMGGSFFAMKGPNGKRELEEARCAVGQLGGRVARTIEYDLPGGDRRSISEIRRVKPLSDVYPRPAAKIKKKPL